MIKSKQNKFGLILCGLVLLAFTIALHILYSLRLSAYHFNSTRFNKYSSAGFAAIRKEDYATAETHFNAALTEAEKASPENKYIISALEELGGTYILLNRYDKAKEACQRLIAVAEKVYGPESEEAKFGRSMIHQLEQQK